jgi:uncharacterized protein YggE
MVFIVILFMMNDTITGRISMRKLFGLIFLLGTISVNASEVRLISVTGTVEKTFKPDIVHLNISIWGKGENAKVAQKRNKDQYVVFLKSIEAYKIQKDDIKTTSYNMNPDYVFDPKTNTNSITGYQANQGLSIKVRKLDDVGSLIDSLVKETTSKTSAINVDSVFFDLDKKGDEERALLGDAVRAAESQAEVLAKAAKVKLKGLYRLTPRAIETPMVQMKAMRKGMMADAMSEQAPTELSSGEIKVNAEVSAEYMID